MYVRMYVRMYVCMYVYVCMYGTMQRKIWNIFVSDSHIFLYDLGSRSDNELGEYIRHEVMANIIF